MAKTRRKLGIWMIGATGNVATTVAIGLAALKKKLYDPIGMVTERPPLDRLNLIPLSAVTLGGHEISRRTAVESAEELRRQSGLFDETTLRSVRPALLQYDKNIRTGSAVGCGRTITKLVTRSNARAQGTARDVIDGFRRDLRAFARRNSLDRTVVIHVASTEPPFKLNRVHKSWDNLTRALSQKRTSPLPASSLYAIAAIEEGMPFVCFTPCLGAEVPAIRELAESCGIPVMGSDGKTGETLLKTVLAPMFRDRNLRIESWVGHNVLGNRDGQVLASSANKAAKIGTKDGVIASIVGNRPQTRTSIEFVESLHDWKTAWDHIHFSGFLGTKMSLQFTWQGCDSILAAPLILDLARLADHHAGLGQGGVMKHLACFFKSPMDVGEHDFSAQIAMLHQYVEENVETSKRRNAETSKPVGATHKTADGIGGLHRRNVKTNRRRP